MPLPDTPYPLSTDAWAFITSSNYADMRSKLLNSGTLTSDAPVTISQTWNNAAVAFTGLRFNAAGTSAANSAAGSVLLDLQVGGTTKVSINKDGAIGGYAYNGLNSSGAGVIQVASGSASYGYHMARDYCVTWGGAATLNGSIEVSLCRDGAANTLALRNGTSAQTFRVYNTYTDASNYERGIISWESNELNIRSEKAGSGQFRNIIINAAAGLKVFLSNSTLGFQYTTAGHLLYNNDNLNDIGASGANRPRNIYVANQIQAGSSILTDSVFGSRAGSVFFGGTDGNMRLTNNAGTDFGRLQFGGTTNLFPAIKRNAAGLQIRLADDSANATLEAGNLYASGNVGIGTTAPTTPLTIQANTGGNGFNILGSAGNFLFQSGGIFGASLLSQSNTSTDGFLLGTDAGASNAGAMLRLQTKGTVRAVIDYLGNVGIGTTAPGAKLHVLGNAIFGENVASATINNVSFGGSYGTSTPGNKANLKWDLYNDAVLANRFGIGMSAGLMEFQAGAGGGFGFYPANTTVSALHIIGSGNVGIGTTSPTSKLDVAGAVTAAGYYTATSGGVSLVANGLWQQGTGHLTLASGAILGWSGAVNVNTDQPGDTRLQRDGAGQLALRNSTNSQTFNLYSTYTDSNNYQRLRITPSLIASEGLGTGAQGAITVQGSTVTVRSGTSTSNRIVINTTGLVGIGVTGGTGVGASKVTVQGGDVEVTGIGNGIILADDVGNRRRITITSGGSLVVSAPLA